MYNAVSKNTKIEIMFYDVHQSIKTTTLKFSNLEIVIGDIPIKACEFYTSFFFKDFDVIV